MYEVIVTVSFSAAHQLRGYDGKYENLHGHNWTATVYVRAEELDAMEVAVDFVMLKKKTEEILARIDYKNINEIPPFDKLNPSAENIARWLYQQLVKEINTDSVKIYRTQVNEFDHSGAAYFQ
tara:strand:+ start:3307 stop:3675 length:369 start_codon:yes stop_codon:yes gene_type:complete